MSAEVQVVQTKLVFPPFSKQISIQISSGATVHLSWNIIGGYEKDCTIAELYNGIKSGSEVSTSGPSRMNYQTTM